MTGPTHRVYSVLFAFIAVILLRIFNITQIGYYQTLLIILVFSKSGALFPDLDHTWKNIKVKNLCNKIINILIHITGGKHRSWQTHSIDICTLFTVGAYFIPVKLFELGKITEVNKEITILILLGFASGWISHLFSDMLTPAGVKLICFLKFKMRFVPRKLGKINFSTGSDWEEFNYKFISILNNIVGLLCLVYPIIEPYLLK